jgi:dodecin
LAVRNQLRIEEDAMDSVARVTTITARSDSSFEDAIRVGVERASRTLRNLTGAWVKEQEVKIADGQITEWEVILEVTFVLE